MRRDAAPSRLPFPADADRAAPEIRSFGLSRQRRLITRRVRFRLGLGEENDSVVCVKYASFIAVSRGQSIPCDKLFKSNTCTVSEKCAFMLINLIIPDWRTALLTIA